MNHKKEWLACWGEGFETIEKSFYETGSAYYLSQLIPLAQTFDNYLWIYEKNKFVVCQEDLELKDQILKIVIKLIPQLSKPEALRAFRQMLHWEFTNASADRLKELDMNIDAYIKFYLLIRDDDYAKKMLLTGIEKQIGTAGLFDIIVEHHQ